MKVLFVSLMTYSKVGGIETFNKYFIEALKENKIETKVLSLHDNFNDDYIKSYSSNKLLFIKDILLEINRYDIVVWSHVNLLPIFLLSKYFTKAKHILITHGIEVWQKLDFIKNSAIKKIDKILTVSNYTKNKIVELFDIENQKIDIFPNCIKLKNKSSKLNPYKQGFNILTILRLDESYKLQSILNILDAIKMLNDEEIYFTIIGKGNRQDYIKEEIIKRNLENKVDLKGFIKDTATYLEYCDIFTLISDREGFGIVYLEAMEYCKPCFSAKNCGSSDVVIDEHNGYSFKVNDIDTLVEKIKLLKNNKDLKDKLGQNGNKLLLEKFTFERYKENQKNMLEELVNGNI